MTDTMETVLLFTWFAYTMLCIFSSRWFFLRAMRHFHLRNDPKKRTRLQRLKEPECTRYLVKAFAMVVMAPLPIVLFLVFPRTMDSLLDLLK